MTRTTKDLTSARKRALSIMYANSVYLFERRESKDKLSYFLAEATPKCNHGFGYRCTNGHKALNKYTALWLFENSLVEEVQIWDNQDRNTLKSYRITDKGITVIE